MWRCLSAAASHATSDLTVTLPGMRPEKHLALHSHSSRAALDLVARGEPHTSLMIFILGCRG